MKTFLTRVEQHQIDEAHPIYYYLDSLCFLSKNLYNHTLFDLRQIHFHNRKVYKTKKGKKKSLLSFNQYLKENRHCDEALELGAGRLVNKTIKRAFDDMNYYYRGLKTYYKDLKKYGPESNKFKHKWKAKPNPPNFKHSVIGRQLLTFENQAVSKQWQTGTIKLTTCDWTLPFINFDKAIKLCEVRIVPRLDYYVIEIVYKISQATKPKTKRKCAIDPGLNNLITCSFLSSNSIIIKGTPVKSINTYYNKLIADAQSKLPQGQLTIEYTLILNQLPSDHELPNTILKLQENHLDALQSKIREQILDLLYRHSFSTNLKTFKQEAFKLPKQEFNQLFGVYTSKKIRILFRRRYNKIKDYMHKASTMLANELRSRGISDVVMGHNNQQKQKNKLKNFVQVPRTMFNTMISYKLEERGINYQEVEESYTSKASAADADVMAKGTIFSGTRIKRGLYKTTHNEILNADSNAAYNIMRKQWTNVSLKTYWVDRVLGYAVTPDVLTVV